MRPKKHIPLRIKDSVPALLAYMSIRQAARHHPIFWSPHRAAIIVVIVPDQMITFAREVLTAINRVTATTPETAVSTYRAQTGDFDADSLTYKRLVALVTSDDVLPDYYADMSDIVVRLSLPSRQHMRAALRMHFGTVPSEADLDIMERSPLHRFAHAFREGRSLNASIARLREKLLPDERKGKLDILRRAASPAPTKKATDGPTLADLWGYGEAVDWGRDLAQDLADWQAGLIAWSDVDHGVLLSGAPGTGKTTFAAALARTCGAHLVAGSVSRWQSYGHLGDLLKQMRKAFEEARSRTPSILFLDELDAVGDRATLPDYHRNYSTQVINGLLELIDGVDAKEGVVIVGATNHPDAIDPALRRPGRLDRHIVIPLPDEPARIGILRYHLRGDLGGIDLSEIAERTHGMSGAGLEQLVRTARRAARRARRGMVIDDLIAALPPMIDVPPDVIRRAAVHEAGHAVVGHHLDFVVSEIVVSRRIPRGKIDLDRPGAHVAYEEAHGVRSMSYMQRRLSRILGGVAAELEVYGDISAGAGGHEGSDLHYVTVDAARMEAAYGMGHSQVMLSSHDESALMSLLRIDYETRRRVDHRIAEALDEARRIVREHIDVVHRIADALADTERLSRDDFLAIVEGQPRLRLVIPTP